jgi:hypothetical protein
MDHLFMSKKEKYLDKRSLFLKENFNFFTLIHLEKQLWLVHLSLLKVLFKRLQSITLIIKMKL